MRFFREPLLHFLLLGASLFVVFRMMGNRGGNERGRIIVTQKQIEYLAGGFQRNHGRLPTAQEREAMRVETQVGGQQKAVAAIVGTAMRVVSAAGVFAAAAAVSPPHPTHSH